MLNEVRVLFSRFSPVRASEVANYCNVCVSVAHRPGVLEEIIHNLDYCDVLVLGEELSPGQESLELQRSELLGKHLDATNSTSGMSIYGRLLW